MRDEHHACHYTRYMQKSATAHRGQITMPDRQDVTEQFIVVLHRPRDVVNIGGTVRALKNMGFRHLRLVDPVPFAPADVCGIAHRSEDVLATMRSYASLDQALADVGYVVGTTEHIHGQHAVRQDIRAVAPELLQRAAVAPVALLFGTEDNGLDLAALDRCQTLLRLPTDPAYPSLNLAQAVLLLLYELRMAAHQPVSLAVASRTLRQSAPVARLEVLFAAWEEALQAIEFFKTPQRASVLRRLRALCYRAGPDEREAALLTAIAREVVRFLQRRGQGPA